MFPFEMSNSPVFVAAVHTIVGPPVTSSLDVVAAVFFDVNGTGACSLGEPTSTYGVPLHRATSPPSSTCPSVLPHSNTTADADADATALTANTDSRLNKIILIRVTSDLLTRDYQCPAGRSS